MQKEQTKISRNSTIKMANLAALLNSTILLSNMEVNRTSKYSVESLDWVLISCLTAVIWNCPTEP